MSRLYLFKFSFGSVLEKNITPQYYEYYRAYFSKLFNIDYQASEKEVDKIKSIPINENNAQLAGILQIKLLEKLKANNLINSQGCFINDSDFIVIDLRGIIKSVSFFPLAIEVLNITKKDSISNDNPRCAIIMDSLDEYISFLSMMEHIILRKKLFIIDKKNRYIYNSVHVKLNRTFNFDRVSKSPLELIQYKLIRKIGHYKRPLEGEHTACIQYFFDGQYCVDEIAELIIKKVLRLKQNNHFNVNYIAYYCPESQWLEEAIYKSENEIKRESIRKKIDLISSFNVESMSDRETYKGQILFITDIIHSGENTKKAYFSLKEKCPKAEIKLLSIFHSGDKKEYIVTNNVRKINVSSQDYVDVEFFLSVKQVYYEKSINECPMCGYDLLPFYNKDTLENDRLTSYELWLMCDEAGYQKEDFPPTEERAQDHIKVMPNSINLMLNNAPYLANKFDLMLMKAGLNKESELFLIFPDETSNPLVLKNRDVDKIDITDTPSGYFIESIKQLRTRHSFMNYQFFGIPREIIYKIQTKTMSLESLASEYPEFHKSVEKLPENLVIVDELNYSWGTFNAIYSILTYFHKRVCGYFPLFDYTTKTNEIVHKNEVKVQSLYQFNLKPTRAYV